MLKLYKTVVFKKPHLEVPLKVHKDNTLKTNHS